MEEMKKSMPTPSFSGNGKKSNNPNLIPALMSEAGVTPDPLKSVTGFKSSKSEVLKNDYSCSCSWS